jgi:hypothetical protein
MGVQLSLPLLIALLITNFAWASSPARHRS